MSNNVSQATSSASSVPPVNLSSQPEMEQKVNKPTQAASFAQSAKSSVAMTSKNSSGFSNVDKTIVAIGVGVTVIAVGSILVFWSTAGVGFTVAVVNIVIDSAAVMLMGGIGTGVAWGLKELFTGVFDIGAPKPS